MSEELPIRLATQDDEPEIMTLCRELHAENGLRSMNEDKVRAVLATAWNRTGGIVAVIGHPGYIEAVLVLRLDQLWYTDDWHLGEQFLFVRKDHRRSTHAKRLIEYAKKAAEHLHVPLVIGVISNDRTAAKVRLYQRQLMPAGAFFVHNARTGGL